MNNIQSFEKFVNNHNTLYVFDFDDTLVNTPSFEEVAQKYLVEKITVKELLEDSIKRIGIKIEELNYENGRIFFNDPNKLVELKGNWIRKGNRVYLLTPNIFSYIDESLPKTKTGFSKIYNNLENKCIVTARPESTRNKIENSLKQMGFEYPKFGLHMLPSGRKNAGMWKGEKIVDIVNNTGFTKVVFFDDNSRYLKKSTKVIKEKLPNIIWEPYKIQHND